MKFLPYIAVAATALLWSSAFPAVRDVLNYYSPEALMLLRFLIASAVFLLYCVVRKVPPPDKRDLPIFIGSGLTGLFLYMWAFNTGTSMVYSGISGFIIAAAPVLTLIMSVIFLKEKAGPVIWLGVLISFGGIVIIATTQVTDMQLNFGIVLLLAAAFLTSAYNIIQKQILKKYSVIQATAYTVIIGTLFMFIFFPHLIRDFPQATMRVNLLVVYLALFPAALAYFLWAYALSKMEKTVHATSFMYPIPFLASVFAFFWLGERLPPLAIVGGIVVVVGMIITNVYRETSPPPKEQEEPQ